MPVIGFLNPASPDTNADRLRGFRQGLKDTGYVEGENVAIEYRWAEGQFDRLPALAADLVRRQVAVIAAFGNSAAFAAKAATTTIPIVFSVGEDPVRLGLVASLARPGGNVTGINVFATELAAKRLELLRELVPAATRVAVLVNPANAATESTVRDTAAAARAMGLQIQVLNASTSREIDAAFATLVRERPDALFVDPDPFFVCRRVQLANLASRHRGPGGIFGSCVCRSRRADELRGEPDGCVSPGRRLYRRASSRATKPADLPVLQSIQVRAGHQSPDRPDARPHRAADAHRHRRRGDRVTTHWRASFAAFAHDR